MFFSLMESLAPDEEDLLLAEQVSFSVVPQVPFPLPGTLLPSLKYEVKRIPEYTRQPYSHP